MVRNCDLSKFLVGLPAARLAAALLVIGADRYRLHRWLDQAKRDTQVVKPILDFLFHRGAPSGWYERQITVAPSH